MGAMCNVKCKTVVCSARVYYALQFADTCMQMCYRYCSVQKCKSASVQMCMCVEVQYAVCRGAV
jgi:hypothetical protein